MLRTATAERRTAEESFGDEGRKQKKKNVQRPNLRQEKQRGGCATGRATKMDGQKHTKEGFSGLYKA